MEIAHPIISIKKFHCGIGVCINLGPNVHYETVDERHPYDMQKTIFAQRAKSVAKARVLEAGEGWTQLSSVLI